MKHPSAYYLLLVYALAVCKPFLPLVSDALAHAFWATEHLETAHHNHGRNHLHDELKEAARQDTADTNSNSAKSLETASVHLSFQYEFDFSCTGCEGQMPGRNFFPLSHAFLEKHTPPPKA